MRNIFHTSGNTSCQSSHRKVLFLLLSLLCAGSFGNLQAQIEDTLFKTDMFIDPEQEKELRLDIDNLSFFKNNEFKVGTIAGYTLPGLWIQPKFVYFPLKDIKLELGLHLLYYWGAQKYPNTNYLSIPNLGKDDSQSNVHLLPFFRAQFALNKYLDIVLGNIYGGSNHNLTEALYNPEYNLTADPEAGLQILEHSRYIDVDAWINWQNFIFKQEDKQETFMAGLAATIKFNKPESKFHVKMPLQMIFQHQGGEIDNSKNSVQTYKNVAAGIGVTYNLNRDFLKQLKLDAIAAYYFQEDNDSLPLNNGYGIDLRLTAEMKNCNAHLGFWKGNDYIPITGNLLYSSISATASNKTYTNPTMLYGGISYCRSFSKAYSIGIDFNVYHRLSCTSHETITDREGTINIISVREKAANSWTAGIYFRIHPSFLLKDFKNKR
ncbi:MAG: hypothetical protein RR319_05365 [Bacteroides sp.]